MSIEPLQSAESPENERLEALRALFPEIFADGRINLEALKEALPEAVEDDEAAEEHYGLTWPGKRAAKKLATLPPSGTLAPIPGEGVDEDTTKNIFIEGDNLEVLRILQKSYAGRVKMIYIDPPYNTGDDRIYKDDFKEPVESYLRKTGQADEEGLLTTNPKASGRYHSNWLSMMYPRLRLARNLLRDDGLIVVNIDDVESSNLKAIMVEIFGEENFLAMISWEKRYTRSNNARLFYSLKDTLVTFRKTNAISTIREARGEKSKEIYSNPDNDDRGVWTSSSYVNPATKEQRPNLVYVIVNPHTGENIEHPTHAWKYEYAEHERHIRENRLWWGKEGDARYPRLKNFLEEMNEGMVPIDLWDYETTGTTDEGGQEIKSLFGQGVFDNPKPTKLIRRLLGLSSPETSTRKEPAIIMDFFAGSGTTGHAVMAQNAADEKERRYILIQLPEILDPSNKDQKVAAEFCEQIGKPMNIAEITKERIRRASKQIKSENPDVKIDTGYRAYRLAPSNCACWTAHESQSLSNIEDLFAEAQGTLKPNWKPADVVTELLLLEGYPLDSEQIQLADFTKNKVWTITHPEIAHTLLICLDETLQPETVEQLGQHPREDVFICRDSAMNDAAKLTLADALRVKTL